MRAETAGESVAAGGRERPTRAGRLSVPLIGIALALMPAQALAHGGGDLTEADALSAWGFDPLLVTLSLVALAIYVRGARRRSIPPWRHAVFVAGLGLVALALLSPIDPIAERLFWVHQIQHMLIRITGPLLIMLAAPQAAMFAGAPRLLRKGLMRPLLRSWGLRATVGWLARPVPAFAAFVGSLYVWQMPAIHNAAVLNPALHYLMHVTMLLAGILFFWVIFEPRDPPKGIRYGIRQLMLVGTILSNILLGSLTTLKTIVLYDAYDLHGRLFGFTPLADEKAGGFLIWQPMSMMSVFAIMVVFAGWNRAEDRRWARRGRWRASNSAALEFPETAAELRMVVTPINRRVGSGLAMVPLAVFAVVLTTAVTLSMIGTLPMMPAAEDVSADVPSIAGPG